MTRLPNLGETVSKLSARRKAMAPAGHGALVRLPDFAPNPGALTGSTFVPAGLPRGAPLVVVLHGCTQNAAGYDRASGWSALAAEAGFALLFAEQNRSNNPNLCFNWFVPDDIARGNGEVESIRAMTEAVIAAHGIDRRRVFITGLSAGGAMTASMLATAPEVFAGGAIIAGVAHGSALNMNEAFDRMRGNGLPSSDTVARLVRAASTHGGTWPRLSVWHGSADSTVDAANAESIAGGWAALQGLGAPVAETVNGHRRLVWRDARGEAIESFTIAGMGHGTPIAAHGPEACGAAAPHMLEAGISSTRRIAAFWGIAPPVAEAGGNVRVMPRAPPQAPESGVSAIINSALRQAGLLR